MSAARSNNDPPPSYQESADGSPYPNDPPPKYEPPKDHVSSFHNVYQQPANGYQAVITGAPVIVTLPQNRWGPDPQTVYCPYCSAHITTLTQYESGALTWLSSGLLCLFGCWLCCPLPFCIAELQDVRHRCRLCGQTLGVYRRFD